MFGLEKRNTKLGVLVNSTLGSWKEFCKLLTKVRLWVERLGHLVFMKECRVVCNEGFMMKALNRKFAKKVPLKRAKIAFA